MNARLQIINRISDIEKKYCDPCNVKLDRNEKQKYCIEKCEHGQKIRELGKFLEGVGNVQKAKEVVKEEKILPSKEEYLKFKNTGQTDKEFNGIWKLTNMQLNALKKEWDLIGKFGPGKKVAAVVEKAVDNSVDDMPADIIDQLQVLRKENSRLKEELEKEQEHSSGLDKELAAVSKEYRELKASLQTPAITPEDYKIMQKAWMADQSALILSRQDCDELKKQLNDARLEAEHWAEMYDKTAAVLKLHL